MTKRHLLTLGSKLVPASLAFLLLLSTAFAQQSRPIFHNVQLGETSIVSDYGSDRDASRSTAVVPAEPTPSLLIPKEQSAEMLSQTQRAVRDADKHFQYGKFFAMEGRVEDSRKEFDLAIEVLLSVPADAPDRQIAERKFEDLIRQIHRYDLERLGAGTPLDSPVFVQSPLEQILDLTFPIDPALKDKALASVRASASQLPLAVNDAVLSYVNYFTSTRGQRTLLFGLKRAGRYQEMITRVLAEEGVPRELIHLAQAESGFMPRALSRKAAAGMWQFVVWRGREYGLASTKEYDERLDPEKATRAAARHLRDLYNTFGDWYLAMAAYNCGPYCVDRAVQRTGYADFWELRRRGALPKETMNYVPAILGMAIVAKNLEAYGLQAPQQDAPLQYDSIRTSVPTNLGLIADAADVPTADLQELNPQVLRNIAPSGTEVKVPKDKGPMVLAALDAVPSERRAAWRLHRVNPGDTVTSIAKKYSTPAGSILAVNTSIDSPAGELAAGDMLLIPAAQKSSPAAKAKVRTVASSKRKPVTIRATAKRPSSSRGTPVKVASASKSSKKIVR